MKTLFALAVLITTGCSTYQPQPNAGHLVPVNTQALGSTGGTTGLGGSTIRYIDYKIRMRATGLK